LRFWQDLLRIVPREELREELRELFEQHRHLFAEEEKPSKGAAAPGPTRPSRQQSQSSQRSDDVDEQAQDEEAEESEQEETDWDEDEEEESEEATRTPATAAGPSFAPPTPAQAAEWASGFPTSPHSSHAKPRAAPTSYAAAAQSGAASPSPLSPTSPSPTSPSGNQESEAELQERVQSTVRAWTLRCEGHVLTLLCTLHEVLPQTIPVGAFIPFKETAPTLREVHSTYLRALRVLHPDKTKQQPHAIQVLSAAVFQAVGAAWAHYEKSEKKKARKEAERAAASALGGAGSQ
jgi:hypothetical protein